MHIALCHDAVVPPHKYGGTERVVYWLGQALLQLGHRVTLIARAGSHLSGAQVIELGHSGDWEKHISNDVDLIHFWAPISITPKKPFIVTIEGNGQQGEEFHPNTVFVSKKHAENHGSTYFVHNGIDPDDFPFDLNRDGSLVFLAKASWKVKNLEGAISVARKAQMPLHILGGGAWISRMQKLIPVSWKIRYHGMVDDQYKRTILRKAQALVFPVRWHEPFGIALTEALASGCPVFATPYGSIPEIVTPDVGYLSSHSEELAHAVRSAQRFTPEACRARVYRGLTHLDMARSYLKFYESILKNGSLSSVSEERIIPKTKPGFKAQELLAWTP